MDLLTIEAYLTEYPATKWLVLGAILLVIEISIISGIGAFFAALGAITLAALLIAEFLAPNSLSLEIAWFFSFTTIWAAVLWIPLKKANKSTAEYNEYKGTHADVIGDGLKKGKIGTVKWSGAEMRARLRDESAETSIPSDTEVWVWEMKKSVLIVDTAKPQETEE